jgi:hypothetical protein
MARLYGYDSPQEMVESVTNIAQQMYVDPEDSIAFCQLMQKKGQVKDFEYRT